MLRPGVVLTRGAGLGIALVLVVTGGLPGAIGGLGVLAGIVYATPPVAFAIAQLGLLTVDESAIIVLAGIELMAVALLIGDIVDGGQSRSAVLTFGLAVLILGGTLLVVLPMGMLEASGSVLGILAVAMYVIHRYELVSLGLAREQP